MTDDGRIWFIWITSLDQGVDHAVTDEDAVASRCHVRCGVCHSNGYPVRDRTTSGRT
jgi:hypothetical protein